MALIWKVLRPHSDPLVYEAKPVPGREYHVTVADDGEIRGQSLSGHFMLQTWVSEPARDYDEAKQFCQDHFDTLNGESRE